MEKNYNRFDPGKNYKNIIFYPSRYIQSAEINELQSYLRDDYKNTTESIFENGAILKGGNNFLKNGTVSIETSLIYANGYTFEVKSKDINIAQSGSAVIGVAVKEILVSAKEDAELLNPAVGTAGFKEEGGDRLKIISRWTLSSDVLEDETFYSVFTYLDGVEQSVKRIAPELDGARKIVSRYDYDSNGNYVVDGLETKFVSSDVVLKKHFLSISKGNGHVKGNELIFEYAQKISLPFAHEISTVVSEPHIFTGDKIYIPRHLPISKIDMIIGIVEKNVSIAHGAYAGVKDKLPNTPAVEIMSIVQGETTYILNEDFILKGDFIEWIGNEPSPGSTYIVDFKYQSFFEDIEFTDDGFFVEGLSVGSSFSLNYSYFLQRIDRLILTKDGIFKIIKGTADEYTPIAPNADVGLSLAQIKISHNKRPIVILDYDKTFKMSDIRDLFERVENTEYNIARINLADNARGIDPTLTLREIFLDPFFDDDMRDMGISQNAVIDDKTLKAEITFDTYRFSLDKDISLTYENGTKIINQTSKTKARLINEYAQTGIPHEKIKLSPSTFNWVDSTYYRWGQRSGISLVNSTSNVFVPSTKLHIKAETFTDEIVDVFIDDIKVAELQSFLIENGRYGIDADITTPADIVSGSNLVSLVGQKSNIKVQTVWFTVPQNKIILLVWRDPIAQTILFTEDTFVQEFDLHISVKPTTYLRLTVCKTTVGIPDIKKTIFTQDYEIDSFSEGWNSFKCDSPVVFESNHEYSLIIECGDAIGSVSVAEIGHYDIEKKTWIQSQPYAGVLLSSSNISTWTAFQKEDLSLIIKKPIYKKMEVVEIGRCNVTDATDLYLLSSSNLYLNTSIKYTAVLVSRDNLEINLNEFTLASMEKYTGEIVLKVYLSSVDQLGTPIINKDIYLSVGTVKSKSTYVSRTFSVSGTDINVFLDVKEIGNSIKVSFFNGSHFEEINRDVNKSKFIGDGWVETCFSKSNISIANTRIKIELISTDINRPFAKNLRGIIS